MIEDYPTSSMKAMARDLGWRQVLGVATGLSTLPCVQNLNAVVNRELL
uniref:Uncharacterized protein n=1 Tax=Lepeophtheirus salmonis TaxID=72036 RepID=A0A0K2VD17_LEPSM